MSTQIPVARRIADTIARRGEYLLEYQQLVVIIAGGLGLWAVWYAASHGTTAIQFQSWDMAAYSQFLTPLFLTALFIERALEVFVTPWRSGGSEEAKARVEAAKHAPEGVRQQEVEKHRTAELEYKRATRRIAFTGGLAVGLLVAAAGVRSIEPMLLGDSVAGLAAPQLQFLRVSDIILTGALLGGGANGLHKVVSLLADFLERTRDRVNA